MKEGNNYKIDKCTQVTDRQTKRERETENEMKG